MVVPAAVKEAEAQADAALDEFAQETEENAANATSLEDIEVDENQQTGGEALDGQSPADGGGIETGDGADLETALSSDKDPAPDYKQMYQTLQGKYNAEVPRLQSQIGQLQSQMTQMMTAPKPAAPEPEVPKGPAHARYLKDDEVEDYGDEILDMQARMAQGVAESVLEKKLKPYQERIDYLESLVASTSSSGFWTRVEQEIPDAQHINANDALWHEFLGGVDPTSGISYRDIGEYALSNGDSDRMANLFKLFFQAQGVSVAGDENSPVEKAKPPVKPGKVASKSVSKKGKAKPVFRESEIKKFFDDVARGKYRGREETMKAREKQIELAMEEGRITAG
jgi:hypothetical protein